MPIQSLFDEMSWYINTYLVEYSHLKILYMFVSQNFAVVGG